MLDGDEPTSAGSKYRALRTRNLPPPVQARLPILIGSGGEAITLKLVAQHADMNNIPADSEALRHKEAVLLGHCAAVGRHPETIEGTTSIGSLFIRDDPDEGHLRGDDGTC